MRRSIACLSVICLALGASAYRIASPTARHVPFSDRRRRPSQHSSRIFAMTDDLDVAGDAVPAAPGAPEKKAAEPPAPAAGPSGVTSIRMQTPRLQRLKDGAFLKGITTDLTSVEFVVSMRMGERPPEDDGEEGANAEGGGDPSRRRFNMEDLDLPRLKRRLRRSAERIAARLENGSVIARMTEDEMRNLQQRMEDAVKALERDGGAAFAPSVARAPTEGSADPAAAASSSAAAPAPAPAAPPAAAAAPPKEGVVKVAEDADDSATDAVSAEEEALGNLRGIALDLLRKPRNETLLALFMREDGTVDWDSARGELVSFGGELYSRINGESPESEEHGASPNRVAPLEVARADGQVKLRMRTREGRQAALSVAQDRRDKVLEKLRELRFESAAVSLDEGAESGDVEGIAALREQLRQEERVLRAAQRFFTLAELDEHMEMICAVLNNEIDQGTIAEREQRLLVAEFGLLDAQVRKRARRRAPPRAPERAGAAGGDVQITKSKSLRTTH